MASSYNLLRFEPFALITGICSDLGELLRYGRFVVAIGQMQGTARASVQASSQQHRVPELTASIGYRSRTETNQLSFFDQQASYDLAVVGSGTGWAHWSFVAVEGPR